MAEYVVISEFGDAYVVSNTDPNTKFLVSLEVLIQASPFFGLLSAEGPDDEPSDVRREIVLNEDKGTLKVLLGYLHSEWSLLPEVLPLKALHRLARAVSGYGCASLFAPELVTWLDKHDLDSLDSHETNLYLKVAKIIRDSEQE